MKYPKRIVLANSKLSPLQQRAVFSLLYPHQEEVPGDNDPVDTALSLHWWVASFLEEVSFLRPEARTHVLGRLSGFLCQASMIFDEPDSSHSWPLLQLAFVDGNFMTYTTYKGFVELRSGLICNELPVTPFETLSYNLTELYRRKLKHCEHLANRGAK